MWDLHIQKKKIKSSEHLVLLWLPGPNTHLCCQWSQECYGGESGSRKWWVSVPRGWGSGYLLLPLCPGPHGTGQRWQLCDPHQLEKKTACQAQFPYCRPLFLHTHHQNLRGNGLSGLIKTFCYRSVKLIRLLGATKQKRRCSHDSWPPACSQGQQLTDSFLEKGPCNPLACATHKV